MEGGGSVVHSRGSVNRVDGGGEEADAVDDNGSEEAGDVNAVRAQAAAVDDDRVGAGAGGIYAEGEDKPCGDRVKAEAVYEPREEAVAVDEDRERAVAVGAEAAIEDRVGADASSPEAKAAGPSGEGEVATGTGDGYGAGAG